MKTFIAGAITGVAIAAAVGFVSMFSARSGEAQTAPGQLRGAGEAGVVEETLSWRPLRGAPKETTVQRVLLKVPQSYGQLTSITGEAEQTLWFVDKDGAIRNVQVGSRLVKIEYEKGRDPGAGKRG